MSEHKTEQEAFWAGDFGNQYISRNESAQFIANNTAVFRDIISRTHGVKSVIELGPNVGMNLHALRHLIPDVDLSAVEINSKAVEQLRQTESLDVTVHETSILEFEPTRTYDLTFTKGVLIHINPDEVNRVYDLLYQASHRYVLVAEYYNPTPVAIPYRGHDDRLFKRDFAGDMLDRFSDLQLIDYKFVYRRDPNFPHDDVTWFLMEKR
ncbi:hypothetical protein N9N28_16375 [Rubripirellula amarantea]|nr:hypothetical protein [Rubripirellula amarantea]